MSAEHHGGGGSGDPIEAIAFESLPPGQLEAQAAIDLLDSILGGLFRMINNQVD